MTTRKRKNDEELVALPSDESEEEEEYVSHLSHPKIHQKRRAKLQCSSIELLRSSRSSKELLFDEKTDFFAQSSAGASSPQNNRLIAPADTKTRKTM